MTTENINYIEEAKRYYKEGLVAVKNSSAYIALLNVIENAENRNTLKLFLFGENYDFTYNDRKYLTYGLTLASLWDRRSKRILLRRAVPFYVLYSIFICRENLNPY